jgi:hypothetical protein
MWVLGYASYRVLEDGRIAVLHGTGTYALGLLEPVVGEAHRRGRAVHRVGPDCRRWWASNS